MAETKNDLVRRGDLISYVCDWFNNCVDCPFLGCGGTSKVCQFKLVVKEVTAVDATEVVTCGDCRHFSGANDADGYVTVVGYCNHINHHIFPCRYDFYCADGEKKEVQDGTD